MKRAISRTDGGSKGGEERALEEHLVTGGAGHLSEPYGLHWRALLRARSKPARVLAQTIRRSKLTEVRSAVRARCRIYFAKDGGATIERVEVRAAAARARISACCFW